MKIKNLKANIELESRINDFVQLSCLTDLVEYLMLMITTVIYFNLDQLNLDTEMPFNTEKL